MQFSAFGREIPCETTATRKVTVNPLIHTTPGTILCTINLAIVLYGLAHPHQISSFICWHEDTSADHLTRFSILKNTELPNAAAVLKWRLLLRLVGNVGISDHWGKPKPFSTDCLVTENQKSIANGAILWTFSEKNRTKFSQFDVFNFAFTLSPLNGVSSRVFLNPLTSKTAWCLPTHSDKYCWMKHLHYYSARAER